jgi:hypothetical protein
MFDLNTHVLLQAFGMLFVGAWLAAVLGRWKRWYWRSRHMVYGYLALGLLFIVSSFEAELVQALGLQRWMVQAGYGVFIAIGIYLLIRPPEWMKPPWIRMIDAEPDYVYETMAEQVKDGKAWEEKVGDPRALKNWIKNASRKGPRSKGGKKKR